MCLVYLVGISLLTFFGQRFPFRDVVVEISIQICFWVIYSTISWETISVQRFFGRQFLFRDFLIGICFGKKLGEKSLENLCCVEMFLLKFLRR